jgi:hypothetical protein
MNVLRKLAVRKLAVRELAVRELAVRELADAWITPRGVAIVRPRPAAAGRGSG